MPNHKRSKRATSRSDINASNDYIISVNAEKRGRSLSQNPYQRLIGRSAVTCPALPWPPYSYRCEARPHEQYVDRDNTERFYDIRQGKILNRRVTLGAKGTHLSTQTPAPAPGYTIVYAGAGA